MQQPLLWSQIQPPTPRPGRGAHASHPWGLAALLALSPGQTLVPHPPPPAPTFLSIISSSRRSSHHEWWQLGQLCFRRRYLHREIQTCLPLPTPSDHCRGTLSHQPWWVPTGAVGFLQQKCPWGSTRPREDPALGLVATFYESQYHSITEQLGLKGPLGIPQPNPC